MSDLLDLVEVSRLTTVPVQTLRYWRWRDRGEGPEAFKLGRRVVYRREAVEAWLRQQEAATAARGGAA